MASEASKSGSQHSVEAGPRGRGGRGGAHSRGRGRGRGGGGGARGDGAERGRGRGGSTWNRGRGRGVSKGGGANGQHGRAVVEPAASSQPFVDTHCHVPYIMERLRVGSFQEVAKKLAMPSNFEAVVSVFCDPAAFSPSLGVWQELLEEKQVYGAFGMHPHNAKYYDDKSEAMIVRCLQHPKAIAWGETGLDFHYNRSPPEVQKAAFLQQAVKAVELGKPLVVHSRKAAKETFDILKQGVPADWPVHVHAFSDAPEDAQRLLKDFSKLAIGITGAVTFDDAKQLRDVARILPPDRTLLETDGPYMVPTGAKQGKNSLSHPGLIPWVASAIAKERDCTIDEVYASSRAATRTVYGI